MRKWLNYWLNDYCDGNYGFAIFTLCTMFVGALIAVVGVVATYGIILLPAIPALGIWAILRWADESRSK